MITSPYGSLWWVEAVMWWRRRKSNCGGGDIMVGGVRHEVEDAEHSRGQLSEFDRREDEAAFR
eukprot:scaffold41867_cov427-Skeletonema_dohrnii-CCMP3373.AAC.1